jgi:hypothetical protein
VFSRCAVTCPLRKGLRFLEEADDNERVTGKPEILKLAIHASAKNS